MKLKIVLRVMAAVAALAAFAPACGSSKKSSGTTSGSSSSSGGAKDFVALGGWNDGACSTSKPKINVTISEPIDVAGTSLKDYVDGTQAAVDAFNKRGGINGGCLNLKVCDGKGDGPTELACARGEVDDTSVVAGLASTFTQSEASAYQLFQTAGLGQIGAQVTQPGAWNSPVSYDFTMGGSGTTLAGIPALKSVGVKKFVVFFPASGQTGAFTAFAAPEVKNLGMQQLDVIQIPPTAVEFTQFVIKAKNTGAEGGSISLPADVARQIIDAMGSLNSNLKIAGSWGSFSRKSVQDIPQQIQGNMAFTDALPPFAATDTSRWPIMKVMLDDFKASGKANLQPDTLTVQPTSGWLSVYALIKVMRDAHATDITRATVKQAFDQAKDVPMFNLEPPWTPAKQSTNPIFKGISNPLYWTGHWDSGKKQFVVDDKQVDILSLLG